MFVIRNAGNLVPHSQFFQDEHFSCEPAGLELGCVVNDIRHIIVCGHSDCKAMNLLHQLQDPEFSSRNNRIISPLRSWLCTHASTSLDKLKHLTTHGKSNYFYLVILPNYSLDFFQRSRSTFNIHRRNSASKVHRVH
jgi:carbonic anhydrase